MHRILYPYALLIFAILPLDKVTELYYGDLEIQIDTRLKKEFMAALKETDLELKSTLDYEKTSLYTFSNEQIPFAMRLERVKTFNG